MPRRFALGLSASCVLLLVALVVARRVLRPLRRRDRESRDGPAPDARSFLRRRSRPARLALFRARRRRAVPPEMREIPAATDDVAFLRSLAPPSSKVRGTRSSSVRFRRGGPLRGAYRLGDGLVVLDLAPPALRDRRRTEGPPVPGDVTGPALGDRLARGAGRRAGAPHHGREERPGRREGGARRGRGAGRDARRASRPGPSAPSRPRPRRSGTAARRGRPHARSVRAPRDVSLLPTPSPPPTPTRERPARGPTST